MDATGWIETLGQDVGFALRQLRRHPVFSATAVITLALGIGANTAVFSAVRGVLLRPLPYQQPEELIALNTRYLPISGFDIERFVLSIPELRMYREEARAVEDVAAYAVSERTVGTGGDGSEPILVGTAAVTANLFPLLGVQPLVGRSFSAEEDAAGAARVAVISHGLWTQLYGGDPAAVGKSLVLRGLAHRIVGVMPEGFLFPSANEKVWTPLGLDWSNDAIASHNLMAVARLAPGRTLEEARTEIDGIAERWAEADPHWVGHFPIAEDLRRDLVGDARQMLLLLQGAVLLVLL